MGSKSKIVHISHVVIVHSFKICIYLLYATVPLEYAVMFPMLPIIQLQCFWTTCSLGTKNEHCTTGHSFYLQKLLRSVYLAGHCTTHPKKFSTQAYTYIHTIYTIHSLNTVHVLYLHIQATEYFHSQHSLPCQQLVWVQCAHRYLRILLVGSPHTNCKSTAK